MNVTNSKAPPEWDLLLSAAQKNRADLIQEMITLGQVNPSHSNSVGQSALHIASLWGNGTYVFYVYMYFLFFFRFLFRSVLLLMKVSCFLFVDVGS